MTDATGLVPVARFALLRAGTRWPDVGLDGLEMLPDGRIELQRLPQVAPASLADPAAVTPSGIVYDCGCSLLIADADGQRLIRRDLDCAIREEVPLDFAPAGMALGPGRHIYVADPNGRRIVVLDARTLERLDEWTRALTRPIALAGDDDRGLLVVNRTRLLRLDADGALERILMASGATAVAVGPDGMAYAARVGTGVARFDRAGSAAADLAPGLRVSALAVDGAVLYTADEATGEILLFSLPDGRRLGSVANFAGPVSALAVHGGTLAIKAGPGDEIVLAPPTARAASGTLTTTAPRDAGLDGVWLRVAATATVPPATEVTVEAAVASHETDVPVWELLPATEALLPPGRFLHLRVRAERRLEAQPGVSPSLAQVEAGTATETLYDRLPATYSRAAADGLLPRLLAFAQATLDGLEERIVDLPASFTPRTAATHELEALAEWQALDLPGDHLAGAAEPARALLEALPALYAARGTPAGISRYVEALTGIRPHLFERFRERALWRLEDDQALGVGTRLAPAGLGGVVVGTSALGEAVPEDVEPLGQALFEEWAHRFVALVPLAAAPTAQLQARVRRALDEERPAHSDYHLCFAGPTARVGIQASVGVDAIVAGPPIPTPLSERALLDGGARLAETAAH